MMGTSEEMEAQRGACSHLHWTPVSRKPVYIYQGLPQEAPHPHPRPHRMMGE